MHLYTWRDLLACFREIERVLVPGGVCLFDVLVPDFEWLRWDPKQRHSATKFVHPRTGQTMCYSTNHDYDPHTQVCHVRIYYDLGPRPRPHNPPHRLVHLAHRQIFPEELRALTHAAGLEWVSLHADFGADPLTGPQNESQCVICRKPEAPAQT